MLKNFLILSFFVPLFLVAHIPEEEVSFQEAQEKISLLQQDPILDYWSDLNESEQKLLLKDIAGIDPKTFEIQQSLLKDKTTPVLHLEPYTRFSFQGNEEHKHLGKQLLSQGKMGCIILAGGQGTRLKFNGPKGMFPISLIKQKTLFQIFAEKTAAASRWVNKPLHLAIMTCQQNDKATRDFFIQHNYFGLDATQVDFFIQSELPFLDTNGNLFLEKPFQISKGPDGNGSVFKSFVDAGLWEKWKQAGIQHINVVLIDNPLADPFDAELLGFHHTQETEITIKSVARTSATEKVGVIVKENGQVKVIEYSEIPHEEQNARNSDGSFKHLCASLSLYLFDSDFFKKMAVQQLPLHLAFKSAPHLTPQGTVQNDDFKAWKYEKFIFDVLPFSDRVHTLIYPREHCFAPLKNFQGTDSIGTVQQALLTREKAIFEEITQQPAPSNPFELAQDFYYPTEKLLQKWRGKSAPDDPYISP